MSKILLLDQETIDKIAAGEVVERPCSVVKELVENAIDAGAGAVTVEIKDGGISLIRITDNGCGIPADEVKLAFLRHSTSKIRSAEDLAAVTSLGFRGEALSSISAVARVELVTKTRKELTGTRYVIEGAKELAFEEVGAPEGTTFLVRDLFYNVPARRKFLKTAQTEGAYISDMVEKLALSHPNVSFKYINNNQTKLHTSGNGNCRDIVYHIYGRDITAQLLTVDCEKSAFRLSGFIGKPTVSRGNRNYENYFINGRYIRSNLISRAIEEAYKSFLMQRQYPFTVLYFTFEGDVLDVNVHPTKMELRFDNAQTIYGELVEALHESLRKKELIPEVPVTDEKPKAAVHTYTEPVPEPFEKRRIHDLRVREETGGYRAKKEPEDRLQTGNRHMVNNPSAADNETAGRLRGQGGESGLSEATERIKTDNAKVVNNPSAADIAPSEQPTGRTPSPHALNAGENDPEGGKPARTEPNAPSADPEKNPLPDASQMTLADTSPDFLTPDARKKHRIIGQLFDTYWLIEYEDKLYIMDQHAAHEKVLFEQKMAQMARKEYTSQLVSPPIVLSLDAGEQEMLRRYREQIEGFGYVVEHFGGREYMVSAVPDNLYTLPVKELFVEMLGSFSELSGKETPERITEKIASMSCRAAVKGNQRMSVPEVDALVGELLALDNPFHCPHGRPTIIAMTKHELEKKFKRIL